MLSWLDHVPLISQVKSAVQVAAGDKKGALKTQINFANTYADLIDSNILLTTCSDHYCSESVPSKNHENWMSRLPDSASITSVTMPGTHNSGSLYGGEFAKCQTWKIYDQLKAGIRFLDIRCRNIQDKFQIYHGIINCHISFDKLIQDCEQFLSENPTEFLIMRVANEGSSVKSTKSFNTVYREYIKDKVIFLKTSTRQVTVKEARGKIFILKNFPGVGLGHEWDFRSQNLQDYFHPESLEAKLQYVEDHFWRADPNSYRFHINFLTASNPDQGAWPRYFAKGCNEKALNLFKESKAKKKFAGIMAMDFPGEVLIQECIERN